MKAIHLISYGPFEAPFIQRIAEAVTQEFHFPVQSMQGHLDLSEFFDPARRQYDGNLLLRKIDSLSEKGSVRTFGLFSVDLFIPILTYIFGQAYLGGHTAIASTFRLMNERYGLPPDPGILLDRTIKEVNHELGHSCGLIHCHHPGCVMTSSTYVEDIDQKNKTLCTACRDQLKP